MCYFRTKKIKKMKVVISFLLLCFLNTKTFAQDITFNKKSGEFTTAAGAVIAKLTDEKVKSINSKNYFLMDASGQTELMAFLGGRFDDTMGGPSLYYYTARSNAQGLLAYRPNFTGMLNTFKEIGEMIVANNFLMPDGKLNDEKVKAYFTEMYAQNGNYPQKFAATNDSMMKLINIPAEPIERDMRKNLLVNEFGKIGQGNVAIGTWEYHEQTVGNFNNKTHVFFIKNSAGGIVCISWIELSGAHTYVYKNGLRSNESWTVPDFINNNPIQHKENFVLELSKKLVAAKLL